MKIFVNRDVATKQTTGSVVSVNNTPMFYGLEPPLQRLDAGPVAFADGVFNVWLRWSEHNKEWVLAVMDVPSHTNIEIHIGNFARDTLDCLLVGMNRATDQVLHSTDAFGKLMALALTAVRNREPITIEYRTSARFPE